MRGNRWASEADEDYNMTDQVYDAESPLEGEIRRHRNERIIATEAWAACMRALNEADELYDYCVKPVKELAEQRRQHAYDTAYATYDAILNQPA